MKCCRSQISAEKLMRAITGPGVLRGYGETTSMRYLLSTIQLIVLTLRKTFKKHSPPN